MNEINSLILWIPKNGTAEVVMMSLKGDENRQSAIQLYDLYNHLASLDNDRDGAF